MGKQYSDYLTKLEHFFDEYLVRKAPRIPQEAKNIIVAILPWLTAVFALISLSGVFSLLRLAPVMGSLRFLSLGGRSYGIDLIFSVVLAIFELLALPGLFRKNRQGWKFLYWAVLVGGLHNLLLFNIPGFVVITGISLYILFQIKELYK